MKKKFAYPLVISLATVTASVSLTACNDNSSVSQPSATPTNPSTGVATSGNTANPQGNPGSANGSSGQSGSGTGGNGSSAR